jgi:nucleotide-binding universal stress UspA family protein
MARCIVCGIDETTHSRHAAAVAARLARDLDSHAVLVRVTDVGGLLRRLPPAGLSRRRRTRRALKAIGAEHCFPDGTDIQVRAGHPASTLMAVAEQEDAELIVVAAGGEWTASAALIGSVSSALMRDARCPVIVVPSDAVVPLDAETMRSVVCGVAGEETDAAVLRLAADLANRFGVELYAVHAYDSGAKQRTVAAESVPHVEGELQQAAEQRLALARDEAGVDARASVLPLPPAEALERLAEHHRAGLIVVASRAGGGRGSFLLGSVPTQLAAQGRTPVLVLPLGARLEAGSGHYELIASSS